MNITWGGDFRVSGMELVSNSKGPSTEATWAEQGLGSETEALKHKSLQEPAQL